MITLEEARTLIGDAVVYQSDYDGAPREQGVVTSVNNRYVFVRFDLGCTSQACRPENLSRLTG